MTLTKDDMYNLICEMITQDEGHLEYIKDNETLTFSYTVKKIGSVDDDYFNGTGSYTLHDVDINVIDVFCTVDDSIITNCDISVSMLKKLYIKYFD